MIAQASFRVSKGGKKLECKWIGRVVVVDVEITSEDKIHML